MPNKYSQWKEIKHAYPKQWVSIIEPETKDGKGVSRGIVIAHNKDKNKVISKTKSLIDAGLKFNKHMLAYTGDIPYIVGLATLEIQNVQARTS